MIETTFQVVSAVAGAIAAGLWIWSARASVPAPPETSGVGWMLGGYLIGQDPKGRRIDLPATLNLQSERNAWAAYAAAVAAVLTAAAVVCHIFGR